MVNKKHKYMLKITSEGFEKYIRVYYRFRKVYKSNLNNREITDFYIRSRAKVNELINSENPKESIVYWTARTDAFKSLLSELSREEKLTILKYLGKKYFETNNSRLAQCTIIKSSIEELVESAQKDKKRADGTTK